MLSMAENLQLRGQEGFGSNRVTCLTLELFPSCVALGKRLALSEFLSPHG